MTAARSRARRAARRGRDGTPIVEVAEVLRQPVRDVARRVDGMIERLRVEIAAV